MADAPPPGLPTLGAPAALSGALADFKEQDRFLPIANIGAPPARPSPSPRAAPPRRRAATRRPAQRAS